MAGAHSDVGNERGRLEMTMAGVNGARVCVHCRDRKVGKLRVWVRLADCPQLFALDTSGVVLELGVGGLGQVKPQCYRA